MVREEALIWGCCSDRADRRNCVLGARSGARARSAGSGAAATCCPGSATGGCARARGAAGTGNDAGCSKDYYIGACAGCPAEWRRDDDGRP